MTRPTATRPGFTGITTTNSYNKRLQPVILSAASPSQTVLSLSYDFHLGTGDNGNLFGITNGRDSLRPLVGSATYTYDPLNRLQSASTTGTDCTMVNGFSKNWGESFNIDAWGNLLGITPTKCSAENLSVTVGTKNWITTSGYGYDAAGNMTLDGQGHSPVYDGENRIKTVAGVNYTYDGDGKRVKKDSGKLYWTGTGSDPLDESDLSGNVTEEYVFFNSKRIARVDLPGGAVHYYFSDHLGSADVVTNATGSAIEQESDYYPYGGERVITAGVNNYKFTGKERDSESGLDDFEARHYSSSFGRFMQPDEFAGGPVDISGETESPGPLPYADIADPQSLNKYSYTYNNPLRYTDPDGHCPTCVIIEEVAPVVEEYGPVVIKVLQTAAVAVGAAIVNELSKVDGGDTPAVAGHFGIMGADGDLAAANREQANQQSDAVSTISESRGQGGVTSAGQRTNEWGKKLGPSREPQIDEVDHSTKKAAKDASRNQGKTTPEQHANPTRGKPHFQPTDKDGKKIPYSTHHNYPKKKKYPKKYPKQNYGMFR